MHPSEFRVVSSKKRPATSPRVFDTPGIVSDKDKKIGVLIILKAASRSMFHASETRFMPGKDTLPDEIHVFVREPIERLRSAYQFFKGTPPIEGSMTTKFTWEEFVDAVLGGAKNPHWRPVSETIAMADVEAIPHLFENLDTEYPLGSLDRKNSSRKADVDMSYRADELKSMYADDYALRAEAEANDYR